ncbi:MAG: hypothetical protein CSA18_01820 [Deltaproteobacteria bacterium]|nr:MAG: hypothetical protein CSA18_01820 [Deltaproteobacteria bacterium]
MNLHNSRFIFLFIAMIFLFSGCPEKKSDESIHSTTFHYSGALKDGGKINIKVRMDFFSREDLQKALNLQPKFNYALDMVVSQYLFSQIKGNKLKLLLNDITRQIFRVKIKNIKIIEMNKI